MVLVTRARVDRPDRPAGESGAFAIIVAIFASVLFIMGALVVEMGVQRESRRDAQNAADAAALAAAAVLANSAGTRSQAVAAAAEYGAGNNFPSGRTPGNYFTGCTGPVPSGWQRAASTSCVSFQPDTTGGSTRWASVQVVTPMVRTPGLFGGVNSGTRAIAQASIVPGPLVGPPVLFARSVTCPTPLSWDGATVTLAGDVHSNGDLGDGSGSVNGEGTYRGSVTGAQNTNWTPSANNPVDVSADEVPRDFPQPYSLSDWLPGGAQSFDPNYVSAPGQVIDLTWLEDNGYYDPNTRVLQPGIYYTDSDITLTGRIRQTNVTLVSSAGVITLDGGNKGLRPYQPASGPNNLVAITGLVSATCDPGVLIGSGRVFLQGVIYAPDSGVDISVGRISGVGGGQSIEAATISVHDGGRVSLSKLPASVVAPATVRLLK